MSEGGLRLPFCAGTQSLLTDRPFSARRRRPPPSSTASSPARRHDPRPPDRRHADRHRRHADTNLTFNAARLWTVIYVAPVRALPALPQLALRPARRHPDRPADRRTIEPELVCGEGAKGCVQHCGMCVPLTRCPGGAPMPLLASCPDRLVPADDARQRARPCGGRRRSAACILCGPASRSAALCRMHAPHCLLVRRGARLTVEPRDGVPHLSGVIAARVLLCWGCGARMCETARASIPRRRIQQYSSRRNLMVCMFHVHSLFTWSWFINRVLIVTSRHTC